MFGSAVCRFCGREYERKDREISVQYIDGSINEEIAKNNPQHLPNTVNLCPDDSNPLAELMIRRLIKQIRLFFRWTDQFPALRSHGNVVDISVKYALGKNKRELREQFLSDSGLQETNDN
ncbi:hypothetical protein NST08_05165 [Paenibacillus sp. FSL K6-1566]|uniref:hypothetical protein n=1 Tax=Paenibacillus sp. FSL K6-1566 TaxID=2954515 RepID=UPI00310199B7